VVLFTGYRSELDTELRCELDWRWSDGCDPIDSVASQFSVVVDHEQDEIAVLGAPQRIWLDATWTLSSSFRSVVDIDHEPVRAGVAQQL
jgi:DUF2075 family protein